MDAITALRLGEEGQLPARCEEQHLPAETLRKRQCTRDEVHHHAALTCLSRSQTTFEAMSHHTSTMPSGPLRCLAMLISSRCSLRLRSASRTFSLSAFSSFSR